MSPNPKPKLELVKPGPRAEAFALDAAQLQEHGPARGDDVGFMARILVQVTMPHSRPTSNEFIRRNGNLTVQMLAPPSVGLPYGTYPRLLLAWLTSEAVRTKSRELELGDSLTQFMHRLDLDVTGGKKGTIVVLREQMRRLFRCTVSWTRETGSGWDDVGLRPVEASSLWWDPKSPDQTGLWKSFVVLNASFFKELVDRPVPLDVRVLRMLARERSPMALDIYSWLTHRFSYLEREELVRWPQLQAQFGGDYGRLRDFKTSFQERFKLVLKVYPAASVSPDPEGLILAPSPTHVPKAFRLDR